MTTPPQGPVVEFVLPNDFYAGKCDPCIARSEYRILVVVHGTLQDVYWQQVKTAMEQASRDTGVAIALQLHDGSTMSQEAIHLRMASIIRQATTDNSPDRPDALIVTLPSVVVHQAVTVALEAHIPVFGFHSGYQVASQLGVLGYVAQDEKLAGQVVARQILDLYQTNVTNVTEPLSRVMKGKKITIIFSFEDNTTTTKQPVSGSRSQPSKPVIPKRVMFIDSQPNNPLMTARFDGLRGALLEDPSIAEVDSIQVNPVDVFQTVETFQELVFKNCAYDAVVLGEVAMVNLVDIAVSAMNDLKCTEVVKMVSFGMSQDIVEAIIRGHISFTAAPQPYIEAVFAVIMASMFITTGKKLSVPVERKMYLSGPVIVTKRNVPADAIQTCREQAFPVCNSDGVAYDPMTTTSTTGNAQLCNLGQGCLTRSSIRIGGVLHGISSDIFWDPVFAAAQQAAKDVGVILELERLEPQETYQILHAKMAARIRNLCESGIDGIFVTVPDDEVANSILYCRELNVPVVSINAGADRVTELGILQHIGQHEYNAGYAAGKRLVDEGMKEAYCMNHAPGNIVLTERCKGFSDAIAERPDDVVFRGVVMVAEDNQAAYTLSVETAVSEGSPNAPVTWDNIGLLLCGASQMEDALYVISKHPHVIVGTFDVSDSMYEGIELGNLKFGIDQQPFLQGALPVYLLTYAAYTQQALTNTVIETGSRFLSVKPTSDEELCESNYFSICSILPIEDMQLISPWLLAIGYVFVATTLLNGIVCIAWVIYYRTKSALVRISQPPFLIALAIGCMVSIVSIIPMGIQTEYRFVKDEIASGMLTGEENPGIQGADAACMMVPWFYSLGFFLVYSSLFGRIWRVQMIFKAGEQMRRRTVDFMDIAPYVAIMFILVLSVLVAWQSVDPFLWEREIRLVDSDGYTLESTGRCTSDDGWYFWFALMGFQIVCLLYALVLCFQTKHIQDDLSESSNTFLAVICIFQINVIAIPISAMVYDETEVFYFVRACAVFLQNYTVLCLMFWPKMYRTFTGTDGLPPLATLGRSSVNFSTRHSIYSNRRVSFSESRSNVLTRHESVNRSDHSRELDRDNSEMRTEERVISPQDTRVSEQSPRSGVTEAGIHSITAEPGQATHPEPGMPFPAAKRVGLSEPGMRSYSSYSEAGSQVQAEPGMPVPVEVGIQTHSEPVMPSTLSSETVQQAQREPGMTYPAAAEPGMPSKSKLPPYTEPGQLEPGAPVSEAALLGKTVDGAGAESSRVGGDTGNSLEPGSGEPRCEPKPEPDT